MYGHGSTEEYLSILQRFADMECTVKSVANGDWPLLVQKFARGCQRTTATTLLPPNGKGMNLFGDLRRHCTGVVFDLSALDTSSTNAWPSGYYAKTEFNMNPDGTLLNGRKEALVSIPRLREQNQAFLCQHTCTGNVAPYNEVHILPTKASALAIFCRTLAYEDLLFTIGIAQLIEHELGLSLPLLIHCPQRGIRIFKLDQQQQMLRCYLAQQALSSVRQHEFKNLRLYHLDRYCGLNVAEKMRIFGLWTCSSDDGTKQTMKDHESEYEGKAFETLRIGMDSALSCSNHRSLRVFAKTAAELMWKQGDEGTNEKETLMWIDTQFDQRFCTRGSAPSGPMLEALGVFKIVAVITSGDLEARVRTARKDLQASIDSMSKSHFARVGAFLEARWKNPQCNIFAFVPSAAIEQRRCFCGSLVKLEKLAAAAAVQGGVARGHTSREVLSLCKSMLRSSVPTGGGRSVGWCWRLELIQTIFGLDQRWSHAALTTSCELALTGMGSGPVDLPSEPVVAKLDVATAFSEAGDLGRTDASGGQPSLTSKAPTSPQAKAEVEPSQKMPCTAPLHSPCGIADLWLEAPVLETFDLGPSADSPRPAVLWAELPRCPIAEAMARRVCAVGTQNG
jgi:hypothetical protein